MRPQSTRAPERATAPRAGVGFATGLARHGARPALVTGSAVLSYDDLADRVSAVQEQLGTEQQLVGLTPAPTPEFVVAYLAALAGGHTVLLSRDEVLPRAYGATRAWTGDGFVASARPGPALHPGLRLLLSTSGSTGSPKLVRLSQANLESNAGAIAGYLGLTADDRALTTLPLGYCYGLSVLHSHLAVGASVVLTDLSVTDPVLWGPGAGDRRDVVRGGALHVRPARQRRLAGAAEPAPGHPGGRPARAGAGAGRRVPRPARGLGPLRHVRPDRGDGPHRLPPAGARGDPPGGDRRRDPRRRPPAGAGRRGRRRR